MLFSPSAPNKFFVVFAVLVSLSCSVFAEQQDADADTAELYEFLFPEKPSVVAEVKISTQEAPKLSFSGFMDDNRRRSWSQQQINSMKEAFKRPEPLSVEPGSESEVLIQPNSAVMSDSPYAELVNRYSLKRNLDPRLVHVVIKVESEYNPSAVSPKGAKGLMQLMDGLSQEFNINPFDPESNINVGTQYLAKMLARFKSIDLALAAYNAGPGNVEKYNGIPPFEETQEYVRKIKAELARMEGQYG